MRFDLDPAYAVLAELLRNRPARHVPPSHHASAQELLSRAREHGVGPLVLDALTQADQLPPVWAETRRRLRAEVLAWSAAQMAGDRRLVALLRHLHAEHIPVVLMKGAALAHSYYPNPYLRPRGDTDLLLSESALLKAKQVLRAAGYRSLDGAQAAGSRQLAFQHEAAIGPGDQIDLHWRFTDLRLCEHAFSTDQLHAEGTTLAGMPPNVRAPSLVHALLIACIHRASNFTTRVHHAQGSRIMPDRLIWLYDLRLLMTRMTGADWAALCAVAERADLRTLCLDGLRAAQRTLAAPLPDAVARRLEVTAPEPSAAYLQPGLVNRLRVDLRAERTWAARLRLARQWTLPDADFLRTKYAQLRHLPAPVLGAWHLLRCGSKLIGR